jgi:hypothetical protein
MRRPRPFASSGEGEGRGNTVEHAGHRAAGLLLAALIVVAVVFTHAGARAASPPAGAWYVAPSGSGTSCTAASPCGSLQAAYVRAAPGDTVYLEWNGSWATSQKIGPAGNKPSASGCSTPTIRSGCVRFTPSPGYTPSFIGSVAVCADYVELDSVSVMGTLIPDGFGNKISSGGVGVGSGDNSCQPSGAPPHDFLLVNLSVSNGSLSVVGSAHDGWVGNSTVGDSVNVSNQLGGVGNNGLDSAPVTDVTYAGVTFKGMTWTDPGHHHPECLHMDYASDHVTLAGDRFLGCRVYSVRVEAEGDPAKHADAQRDHVFDGIYADAAPVNFDCHDNNCMISGITVENSTLLGGLSLTNDCRLVAGRVCTVVDDTVAGNTIAGPCPASQPIFGGGWSESWNAWRDIDPPFPAGTICAQDSTST